MEDKKPPHRPTIFTDDLATEICLRVSNGESLRSICRDKEMPSRKTVHLWLLDKKKKDFLHQYNLASDVRTDELFDELEEIADNEKGDVQRDRLRVDTRKWYLSKVMPKKYGDKLQVDQNVKLVEPIMDIDNEIQEDNSDKEDNIIEEED